MLFGFETSEGDEITSCHGSLIAPEFVLLPAHCFDMMKLFYGVDPFSIMAVVGENERSFSSIMNNITENEADYGVQACTDFINHPDYIPTVNNETLLDADGIAPVMRLNRSTGYRGGNNFALCKLNAPVEIDTASVYLELDEEEDGDDNALVDQTATMLGGARFTIVENAVCDSFHERRGYEFDNTDTMLCVYVPPGSEEYMGGHGSALTLVDTEEDGRTKHTLVGLMISYSQYWEGEFVEYFSRVSAGMDWINQTVCVDHGSSASFCETTTEVSSGSFKKPSLVLLFFW